jgi:hypothetical protein
MSALKIRTKPDNFGELCLGFVNFSLIGLEKSKGNRLELLRNWIFKANAFEKAVSSNNWLEMKSFLHQVGSNRLLRAQTLTVSFKRPFDLLAETTLAIRNTSDVSEQCSRWWSLRDSNP